MRSWDTPAGRMILLDSEYCYEELVPTLEEVDGKFYLDHNWGVSLIAPIFTKLSQCLNDIICFEKNIVLHILRSRSLLESSSQTVESLDRETIIKIFKKNFESVKTFSDMERVFNGLRAVVDSGLIEDLRAKDSLFDFLNKKDATALQSLFNLNYFFNFRLHNPSEQISVSKGGVVFNYSKQVVGLQIRGGDSEEYLHHVIELENLQVLNLVNAKIRELPESIGKLTSLKQLNVSNIKLETLESISNRTRLSINYIRPHFKESKNNIQHLPDSIKNLKNLESLNLSGNQITEIKGLDRLKNLRELSFFGCKISEIKNLDQLTNLTSLDLGNNQIAEIKGLETLTKLKSLNLGDNQITEIKGLETLTLLNRLDLTSNEIPEVKGLGALSRLNWLSLLHNPVVPGYSLFVDWEKQSNIFKELNIVIYGKYIAPKDVQKLVEYCKTI